MKNLPSNQLRPREFAVLLLSSRDLRPRKRARDQRADSAGIDLKRRILESVAELDPEANELEEVLLHIIENIGPPFGPTRAVASVIHEEWQTACATPDWLAQLLSEAVSDERVGNKGKRSAE